MPEIVRAQRDRLNVEVHEDRTSMGCAAARLAGARIREMIARDGVATVVFASAASQVEALAALREESGIHWQRVIAFHMDEYVGMKPDHPASFRRFLREQLVSHVPIKEFHELRGECSDPEAECERYSALLEAFHPGLVILGIGENGHIAFNDPPVARFDDPALVKLVELDDVCRRQQVHDGAFPTLDDVPRLALSLTVPALFGIPKAVCVVPGPTKAQAVLATLDGPVSTACPASILRTHPDATLFLDRASAALVADLRD